MTPRLHCSEHHIDSFLTRPHLSGVAIDLLGVGIRQDLAGKNDLEVVTLVITPRQHKVDVLHQVLGEQTGDLNALAADLCQGLSNLIKIHAPQRSCPLNSDTIFGDQWSEKVANFALRLVADINRTPDFE